MKVVYAKQPFPTEVVKTIFLAGPTPRSPEVESYRGLALDILEKRHYDGHVFVPEDESGSYRASYVDQVGWEDDGLNRSDCNLFWVSRNLKTLPGFTTNHEFGEWFKSGKVVLGAPAGAPKLRYLRHKASQMLVPQAETLEETIDLALEMIGEGALRKGTECLIPLQIWNTQIFQSWYSDLRRAGNRMDGARVEWNFRFPPDLDRVFSWILRANVYVAAEGRNKDNEVVLGRPSGSAVLLYKPAETIWETEIVLVREFRSPVSNRTGYVWELPGGSSFSATNPLENAVEEVEEETGLVINPNRLREHGTRQIQSTLSAHKTHLFSAEITDGELIWLRSQKGQPHGLEEATERTFVEVRTLREIMQEYLVDWSCLGMILSVLQE